MPESRTRLGRTRLGQADRPLAVAHRGEPVGHRENTLPALAAALRAGADIIEIDVKVTADGTVVLLHDDTLNRLWNRSGDVTDLTYTQLRAFTSPSGGIPTLVEALALVTGTGAALLIDMDSPAWAAASQAVVTTAIDDGWLEPDEILWCGRPDALEVIRDADPEARIVLSWDAGTNNGALPDDGVVGRLRPEAFNPHWPMMTAETVSWAHERQLAATCWTVDDDGLMRTLLALGVDAMTSNHISKLRKVIDEHAR
jgi:glycerophosphoryl diester phosphodiesterase